MSTKLEIEKKFLVNFPSSWSDLAEMFDGLVDVKRISQTYLKPKDDEPAIRVRKTIEGLTGDTDVVFHFNQKTPVETGVHKEKEHKNQNQSKPLFAQEFIRGQRLDRSRFASV